MLEDKRDLFFYQRVCPDASYYLHSTICLFFQSQVLVLLDCLPINRCFALGLMRWHITIMLHVLAGSDPQKAFYNANYRSLAARLVCYVQRRFLQDCCGE